MHMHVNTVVIFTRYPFSEGLLAPVDENTADMLMRDYVSPFYRKMTVATNGAHLFVCLAFDNVCTMTLSKS